MNVVTSFGGNETEGGKGLGLEKGGIDDANVRDRQIPDTSPPNMNPVPENYFGPSTGTYFTTVLGSPESEVYL